MRLPYVLHYLKKGIDIKLYISLKRFNLEIEIGK